MSDPTGCQDKSHIAFDSSVPETSPELGDLSPRDKPWDKHRGNADRVQGFYASSTQHHRYAERINDCAQLLEFLLAPDVTKGELCFKLASARFCRVRHCPICQWRRSLMWKAKAYKVLPNIIDAYPLHRWLFVTLTVKNCPITELRQTLQWMNKSFQRMSQRKIWPAVGWLRSTEVTRSKDGSAHPHFHCLLMVPAGYFGRRDIKQVEWVELWKNCLRIDYRPILDVQAIKQGHKPMELVPELLKYCTKESDLVADREWFLELTEQMHKMKCVTTGSVLKDYLRDLEEEPEDLIGESDDPDEVDEGSLYFGWRRVEKKYRMVE